MKNKPRLYFAYTIPLSRSRIRRAIDKVCLKLKLPPLYRGAKDFFIPWQKPVRSPHCLTYHLLKAFKEKRDVKLYNLYEKVSLNLDESDIFIGQPLPAGGFGPVRSETDERDSVTSKTVRQNPNKKTYLIMPYTHDPLYVNWARDLVASSPAGIILVGGKIWEEDWETKSPFKDISINKKIHIRMGIDPNDYPLVKNSFNPKGQRKFLYIGHTGWYKNTAELERIAEQMPNFVGAHIGGGEVKGWKKLANFADLTPSFMKELAKEYDIFLTTSTGDAQATTILEQMCFGLVVACTPETGYDHQSLIKLSTHDTSYNIKELEKLQQAEESQLLSIARENRKTAIEKHSWEEFTKKVVDFIGL